MLLHGPLGETGETHGPLPRKMYLNAGNKLHRHNIYIYVLNLYYRSYFKGKQLCSNTVFKIRVLKQGKYYNMVTQTLLY